MNKIREHPIIKKLFSLNLPTDDYAIFGSGPIFAHGIIDLVHDIDIIARGKAWTKTTKLGKSKVLSSGSTVVQFFGDEIEILHDWFPPGKWNIDKLIDTADVIDGIRFVTLKNVLKWKREMSRPKDLKHIKVIEEHIKKIKTA